MLELKTYILPFESRPTLEDITECLEVAKKNNAVVELRWNVKWSGKYSVLVYPDTDAVELYERLPKSYGI